jgi:hypothetical protein
MYFYSLLTLFVVTGFFFIKIVIARVGQRRKSRLIERGLAEYLRDKAPVQ